MRSILAGFLLFFFITALSLNHKDIVQVNSILDHIDQDNPSQVKNYGSHEFKINETFSIEGALISTIVQNLSSFYPNVYNGTGEKQISDLIKLKMPANNRSNNEITLSDQSELLRQQAQTLFPIPKPISQNSTNIESNAADRISDNLVSLLSGIIVESIHNGNPTINNEIIQTNSDDKGNKDNTIIVSGNWRMDVENGNVTDFNAKFVMITSNGSGFHWHSMDNLKTTEKLFLGKDYSAMINGNLDFFTGNNTTKQPLDILLVINNLEFIQITLLDKDISSHFYEFPMYGTIDSIKTKN